MTPAPDPKQAMFCCFGRILGRGTGSRGLEMAVACLGIDSQVLATILDTFRTILSNLRPNRLSETRTL